jgi:hypothetical protein
MSKPQEELYRIACRLYGRSNVINEYTLENGQRIDVAVPCYNIAMEYHGRQHYEFVEHFHKSTENYIKAVARDRTKEDLCREAGWKYVVFSYKDILTEGLVMTRIINTEYGNPGPEDLQTKLSKHKEKLDKAREIRKARYQSWKLKKKAARNDEEK